MNINWKKLSLAVVFSIILTFFLFSFVADTTYQSNPNRFHDSAELLFLIEVDDNGTLVIPLSVLLLISSIFFIFLTILLYYFEIDWKMLCISVVISAIAGFGIYVLGHFLRILYIVNYTYLLILILTLLIYIFLMKRRKKEK